ncbi:hypothetical protein F4780DRAFT_547526 [Xylariomycetidae sp. FL0641]|nr:hypothetical protein F4780DRAFT_547526 [Xylariomycetidae sp. FL0641]
MDRSFSSTFDALQAHFKQPQQQPDAGSDPTESSTAQIHNTDASNRSMTQPDGMHASGPSGDHTSSAPAPPASGGMPVETSEYPPPMHNGWHPGATLPYQPGAPSSYEPSSGFSQFPATTPSPSVSGPVLDVLGGLPGDPNAPPAKKKRGRPPGSGDTRARKNRKLGGMATSAAWNRLAPSFRSELESSYPDPEAVGTMAHGHHAPMASSSYPPLPAATTDALLQRQIALRDESAGESTSERRRPGRGRGRGRGRPPSYWAQDDGPLRDLRGGRTRGGKRGPRKAAEPTGDVKMRIHKASEAYMDGHLEEAIEWVEDAIRINAETYRAWTLLMAFLEEKGDRKGSFMARVFSCNLQPKVVQGWIDCAEAGLALREEHPEDEEYLEQSMYCFSRALRADINNREARHGRAALAFEKGQIKTAAKDYNYLLERCCYDTYALRGMAEMSVLLASTKKRDVVDKPHTAIKWYRLAIAHFRENGMDARYPFEWQDVYIFAGLLAFVNQTKDALKELKSLSRWLLGRSDEDFWDDRQDDDREWDMHDSRRREVAQYQVDRYPDSAYGMGLSLDLRTKLAVYRLKLGDVEEAMHHVEIIDPEGPNSQYLLSEEPHLIAEAAIALYEAGARSVALRFFTPVIYLPDLLEPPGFLAAGRCFLDIGDKRQAEECFAAAIDADETSRDEACIDARYELAKMYEAAREEREAFILVNEAIRLQRDYENAPDAPEEEEEADAKDQGKGQAANQAGAIGEATKPKKTPRPKKPREPKPPKLRVIKPKIPRPKREKQGRRRPMVFAFHEEQMQAENQRSAELDQAWAVVNKERSEGDGDGPTEAFMASARELIDDFRSYKNFYSWDKYLSHMGIEQEDKDAVASSLSRSKNLVEMRERLSHTMNPEGAAHEKPLTERTAVGYRGVPFNDWLQVFLEYAIALAHRGQFQEAYKVIDSARDAEVFLKDKEDMFLIHIAWAACALRGRDEEICVAAARFLMREYQFDTDGFRMFAALSRLCPSPASWYASGPVQKYLLRQIKLMDRGIRKLRGIKLDRMNKRADAEDSDDEKNTNPSGLIKPYPSKDFDTTLLTLYGHILFVSNSFIYALNYFFRAYSIDPSNTMVLLSIGQCYIHYALKRQSENRQYHLVQGFTFLHRYYAAMAASPDAAVRQEAHYNMGRSYHAVGIPHLAADYYRRALDDAPDDAGAGDSVTGREDISREAAYNLMQLCWAGGDEGAVRTLAEKYLVL